jgi:ferredoxin
MIVQVSDFNSFLKKILSEKLLSIQEVIIPSRSGFSQSDNLFFKALHHDDKTIDLGMYRTADPVKFLFYLPRVRVFPAEDKGNRRLIAGLKACDVNALEILDTALTKSGFTDNSYKYWRENSIIISLDCARPLSNCFCTFLGQKPFPAKGFDLNLSELEGDYFITVGSAKGEELLDVMKRHTSLYRASEVVLQKVKDKREKLIEDLNKQIQTTLREREEKHSAKDEASLWLETSKNCVGCGSCTNSCPSCYCLILNDESKEGDFIKVRTYDSCQLHGYARVAGGGTPRPKVLQRFRNRVMCKFTYMKSNFGFPGCTGCGRCMDICNLGFDFVMMANKVLASPYGTGRGADFGPRENIFKISQKA